MLMLEHSVPEPTQGPGNIMHQERHRHDNASLHQERLDGLSRRRRSASLDSVAASVAAVAAGISTQQQTALVSRHSRASFSDAAREGWADLRGVGPQSAQTYREAWKRGAWLCVPPGGQAPTKLALAALNDDFCDCADGSDEPGTSACAGQADAAAQASFECRDVTLFASRVDDGIW